jgi:thiamine transport system ATP-binding protein
VTELRALFVRLGLTSLFVTHDHDEAFALADRLVVMHEGRIEQVGTPVDVWQRPANAFVARFLGWNVTHAFADGLVAVRADGLELVEVAHARVTGTVTARTFRREHFLLDVDLEGMEREHVQAEVPLDHVRVPDVGAVVGVRLVPGAAVPLP